MPTPTPIMQSSVPCDGNWHRIGSSGAGVLFSWVYVKFNGAHCTFTARLIDDPPAGAPPGDASPRCRLALSVCNEPTDARTGASQCGYRRPPVALRASG